MNEKKNIEALIIELSQDKNAKPRFNPMIATIKWVMLSAFYCLVVLSVMGLRPDMAIASANNFFVAELILLEMILILSLVSCANLATPDVSQKKYSLKLVFAPLAALGVLAIIEFLSMAPEARVVDMHGLECTICITLLSVIPAVFLFYEIKKAAPTKLRLAGFFCLVYSATLGAFILRLSEPQDSVIHLIVWHYIPAVAIGLFGYAIGRKIFKW